MPRGDGKKNGEPRKRTKLPSVPTPISKKLKLRIEGYEAAPDAIKEGFTKPGSQKK